MQGYTHPLYILPFDHRASFTKNLFHFSEPLSSKQIVFVKEAKHMIFQAFLHVYTSYAYPHHLGILVDEQFGSRILDHAKTSHIIHCVSIEKSGQRVFAFEYGKTFMQQIQRRKPDFVKALVRYNPSAKFKKENEIQLKRLKQAYDVCESLQIRFLIEPLAFSDHTLTSQEQADMMTATIQDMHQAGIFPAIWKLEPYDHLTHWKPLIQEIKEKNEEAGIIVLGRAGSMEQVKQWLAIASDAKEINGFAVGRTIFFEPLEQWYKEEKNREEVIDEIARRFQLFIDLWTKLKDSKK